MQLIKEKTENLFSSYRINYLLGVFFLIRLMSFLWFSQLVVQNILSGVTIVLFVYLYYKNPKYSWYVLIGELFIAGSGQYLKLFGLSIRSLLFIFFSGLACLHQFFFQHFFQKQKINTKALAIFGLVFVTLGFYTLLGYINGHGIESIRDAIPFAYLFLFFPAYYLMETKTDGKKLLEFLIIFVLGTAIFSLFTFILFSSGFVELQEPFYNWFRDVNFGKITNMGSGFFRIVEQSHILVTPIILIISSLLMDQKKRHIIWNILLIASLLIFVLNLSRDYMLALAGGFVILLFKHSWKSWLKVTTTTLVQAMLIFVLINFTASRGQILGLGLFEGRVTSITQPESQLSSRIRMILLPEIIDKFMKNPIIGTGLGATLEVPKLDKTTPEFDWGYFEMLVEFGILGTTVMIGSLLSLVWEMVKKIYYLKENYSFLLGIFAGLAALGAINVTEPALFHLFGVVYIVLATVVTIKYSQIKGKVGNITNKIFSREEVQK